MKGATLEKALDLSYRKSGEDILPYNEEVVVSPELVKEIIHDFKKEKFFTDGKDNSNHTKKKKCQFLFIEADEDHVPAQKGGKRKHLAKLVYIHEGKFKLPEKKER